MPQHRPLSSASHGADALLEDETTAHKKALRLAWRAAGKSVGTISRTQEAVAKSKLGVGETLRSRFAAGFFKIQPTPLRLRQRDVPPDSLELVIYGLNGELLLGPEVCSKNVHLGYIKERLAEHALKCVVAADVTRGLRLHMYISSGCEVQLLFQRKRTRKEETLRWLATNLVERKIWSPPRSPSRSLSPGKADILSEVSGTLPDRNTSPERSPNGEVTRIPLNAVVFVQTYSVVAWGDPGAGGYIGDILSKRLAKGVMFVHGNDRAYAAVIQGGAVETWGDPACGGDAGLAASQMASKVFRIFSNQWAFCALKEGGQAIVWGDPEAGGEVGDAEKLARLREGITRVYNTDYAFAALRGDAGEVITWGDPLWGGDSSAVESQIRSGVTDVSSTEAAFVARKRNGALVAWGEPSAGADLTSVAEFVSSGVDSVQGNTRAFAATKAGSVTAWGDPAYGGDASRVAEDLRRGVIKVFANGRAFAALKNDGGVVAWGDPRFGGDARATTKEMKFGVDRIVYNSKAFAGLKPVRGEGQGCSVIAWGHPSFGGDLSGVAHLLTKYVSQVVANDYAFTALKSDGSVISWGDPENGGDASEIAETVKEAGGAVEVKNSGRAFAARLMNGAVVAWGDPAYGGDASPAAEFGPGNSKIVELCSNEHGFAARTKAGHVVAWGNRLYGGSVPEGHEPRLEEGVTKLMSNRFSFVALKRTGTFVT
eukprot:TRINITY_DN90522_c0_g1_i1.p1 TRINITY_DN90522_c0_g1~~TRINITY_DN90522_c0_g1_i1.p1  ORF type:complete len:733 (-),score=112.53 TRINITY_DN90522_c0_g1_i1:77-2212(-)